MLSLHKREQNKQQNRKRVASCNAEVRQMKPLEDPRSTIITNSITGHRKLRIDHHSYASSSLPRTTNFRSCRNENSFLFYLAPLRDPKELWPLYPLNLRAARKQIAATDRTIHLGRPINCTHNSEFNER